ncbi:hypothetical protein CO731_05626 (plasmid) [Aminobacter sp. MSH1]|uniref:hypothetical protein n=1 Tax=Aminobacter sp. MSH1 TaxID=374606 RepID=UPI0009DC61F6|nr:hypothetical protein [Aminobacter sp. MSH1]ARD70041.1 hypothetical protein CO731_05626 [Aminobacter sp. MSH1]
MIIVTRIGPAWPSSFMVEVSSADLLFEYCVVMDRITFDTLAADYSTEALIEATFRFLLDRVPNADIRPLFELARMARDFPDFEAELPRYLAMSSKQ